MSTPPSLPPSGSGPNGPLSDDALVDHYVTTRAGGDLRKAVDMLIKSNRDLHIELRNLRAAGVEAAKQRALAAIGDRPEDAGDIDAAADMVIAACDGDARAAVKATLVANGYLETELDRIAELVSPGFARGRIRPAG